VKVAPVDKCDLDRGPREAGYGREPAEPATDDDDSVGHGRRHAAVTWEGTGADGRCDAGGGSPVWRVFRFTASGEFRRLRAVGVSRLGLPPRGR
jgi:hypothetical protein